MSVTEDCTGQQASAKTNCCVCIAAKTLRCGYEAGTSRGEIRFL